mmetsp:Transcript_15327/g.44040  ORF Transcript_15327/g.44040 Transcript_15327/m.44040 type:complete len:319 (-) Transcript_15327:72-1028(-)
MAIAASSSMSCTVMFAPRAMTSSISMRWMWRTIVGSRALATYGELCSPFCKCSVQISRLACTVRLEVFVRHWTLPNTMQIIGVLEVTMPLKTVSPFWCLTNTQLSESESKRWSGSLCNSSTCFMHCFDTCFFTALLHSTSLATSWSGSTSTLTAVKAVAIALWYVPVSTVMSPNIWLCPKCHSWRGSSCLVSEGESSPRRLDVGLRLKPVSFDTAGSTVQGCMSEAMALFRAPAPGMSPLVRGLTPKSVNASLIAISALLSPHNATSSTGEGERGSPSLSPKTSRCTSPDKMKKIPFEPSSPQRMTSPGAKRCLYIAH